MNARRPWSRWTGHRLAALPEAALPLRGGVFHSRIAGEDDDSE